MKRNELLTVIGLGLQPGFLGPFHITHIPLSNTTLKTDGVQGPLGSHQSTEAQILKLDRPADYWFYH